MKRKHMVWVLLLLGLISGANQAYGIELGAKAGIMRSLASISRDIPGITYKSITEFTGGIFVSVPIFKTLSLQPEINYAKKGFNAVESDLGQEITSKYKISYIEIPLLIAYQIPLKGKFRPGAFFGPYIGWAQKVMEVQTAFGETEKRELGDNLKKTDFGLVFGGNLKYDMGTFNLLLDVRYSVGLTNISKYITEIAYEFREDDYIKNRAFSVTLGLSFNL